MSNNKEKDTYLGWLADAHSMENTLVQALEDHIKDAQNIPELRVALERHLAQTRQHANLVKSCLDRYGATPSTLKNTMGTLGGTVKNMMNAANADEIVKNTIDDYVAEHLEIASYTSLLAAAEQFGDQETAQVCRQILPQEQEAATILERMLPVVTLTSLRERATA